MTIKEWAYPFLVNYETSLDPSYDAVEASFIDFLESGDDIGFMIWWNYTASLLQSSIFRSKYTNVRSKIINMYKMNFIWRLSKLLF
jgi:hypothetical protein